jgi:diaminohydroxyphosphoribosylaminopyrimidine deaminase/5-amino-6-(5-phosphoribosylamino)uracil reductase
MTGLFSSLDHVHMARALRLAERGLFTTTPNPRVGCVLAQGDRIVGEGWHVRAGEPHAEVHALRMAGELARGATAYVTLEPCSHHGRTPPCANALIDAGVGRVVAAMRDPNPQVAGGGLHLLTLAGVAAQVGLLEAQARELNPGFISRMERGRPWVRVKSAASLDGRTALANGVSQWITGDAARTDVQRWRARACAVLTGVGTILADNPRMNVRGIATPRQPLRVIVDSHLRTPVHSAILAGGKVLIACLADALAARGPLERAGAEVIGLPGDGEGRVDLRALLEALARRGINEVHVEAGARLHGALLRDGLVDEWVAYQAPLVFGDGARGLFGLPELTDMSQRYAFRLMDQRQVGQDQRLILRPQ